MAEQAAANFDQRQDAGQGIAIPRRQIVAGMAESLPDDLFPAGQVKESAMRMRADKGVPGAVARAVICQ
jgi:hypothetical protein